MPIWLIEPHDPIIARDGRPFGPNPGARASSLPFPHPSTLIGAMRAAVGSDETGSFDKSRISELLNYAQRGPLLAEYSDAGDLGCMAPAPADALLLQLRGDDKRANRRRLVPLALAAGAQCGWPPGSALQPVGPRHPSPEKPLSKPPRFWHWRSFEQWLLSPGVEGDDIVEIETLGHQGATHEARMHVRIDALRQSAEEGMLFQTSGLEFTRVKSAGEPSMRLTEATRLVLVCATDAPLQAGVASLGGERRLVRWFQADGDLPTCPPSLHAQIVTEGHCRLLLLTPAYFTGGFLPDWLLAAVPGVKVQVIAAALGRFQGLSGWDYDRKQAKAARKLAPAGAVYFLKLDGTSEARAQFVDAVWMHCVSDDQQSRLDGFGLAALGVWDGQLQTMEVESDAT